MKKASFTIKAFLLLLLPLLGWQTSATAQNPPTELELGDIAFVAYQGDNPDLFAFVLLKDINGGTQITFTDNGWFAAGDFRTGEGVVTVTFNQDLSCGEVITVGGDGPVNAAGEPIGSNAGSFPAFSTSGDQLFAYQGTAPTAGDESNFLAALQMNSTWDSDATSSNTSARPSVFTDGVNSNFIEPEVDNAEYNCGDFTGTPAEIAAEVNNNANWSSDDNIFTTFPYTCNFTCGVMMDPCLADAGDLLPAGPITINEGDDTPEFTADYSAIGEIDPNAGNQLVPKINEVRIDQPSDDNDEYFEIFGTPGTDLSEFTYLVIGDGTGGSGVIENVTSLAGQAIPASGYFVAAMGSFTLGVADLTTDLNFENSDNVTHLLVRNFTGADGDDLDTDDDGTLDVLPWSNVVDAISLVEEVGAGDQYYAGSLGFTDLGPDGTFVPGHAFVSGGMWNIGAFDPVGGDDTPGSGDVVFPPNVYIYVWVVTDGAPNYNIIAVAPGAATAPYGATFSGLQPGTYCVHGLSFLGTIDDLVSAGFTTGLEVLAAIDADDICADLEVDLCIPLTVEMGTAPCLADAGDILPVGPVTICEGDATPEFTANYDATDENDPNAGQGGGMFGPIISELRLDQSSTDNDEFFEIYGTPGTDLSDYTYLVIGDPADGVIENVTPLTGQTIPGSGYFVAAEGTFTIGTADFVTSLNFENSDNVTHLLVEGFTGNDGDDLDTNDDGVLDILPWTSVVDAVSLIEPGVGNAVYAVSLGFQEVGPDGSFLPASVAWNGAGWDIIPFADLGANSPGSGALVPPVVLDFIYVWVVTDGAPDYNIVAVKQGNPEAPYGTMFMDLAPGTYCVHGLSFQGSIGDLVAEGFTTGLEVLAAIDAQDICADLIVDECIPLIVNPAVVANAGNDQIVCEGDIITVGAFSDGEPGSWSGGAGTFADATSNSTTYTPDASEIGTTVVLTWTTNDNDGVDGPCGPASDDVMISILAGPDAEFSYDMEVYCPNGIDPILSHDTGVDGIYSYVVVNGGPVLALDPETGAIDLAGSDQGTYEVTNTVSGCGNLVISGIVDGPVTGGVPKAIEFTAVEDIPDLSIYGWGSANNGGGTNGEEFTFPAVSLSQGDHVWVASESVVFTQFFGFAPTYISNAALINGDDAIELFCNGTLIDLYGDQNVDGSGEAWEYTDGWAYRNSSTGPDGGFVLGNWILSGPDGLEGAADNATAANPMPIGTYFSTVGGVCPNDEFTVTITIIDNEAPILDCPNDIVVILDPGACGTFVDFEVTAVDNCDPNPVIMQVGGDLGDNDYYEIGTYDLEFEAEDIFGNVNECEFSITVNEFPNPTATLACNDNVQISIDATGCATIGADAILEGGPYGCYDDYIVDIQGLGGNEVCCPANLGGPYTVTVTDPDTGNKCWGSIIVEDKLAPVFNCPTAPIQISCLQDPAIVLPPVATDNCTTVDYQLLDEVFTDLDACDDNTVTLMRTWTATDNFGNTSAECVQQINIVRPDEIDFPNDITWECSQYESYPNIVEATVLHPSVAALQVGTQTIVATGITSPNVLNNTGSGIPSDVEGTYCQYGSTFSDEVIETCGNTFKIIRTWTVLDWCTNQVIIGNSQGEDNIQVIKVVDDIAPVITMNPYTVNANVPGVHPNPCNSQEILPPANVTDNCSDWTLRIFTPVGEALYVNGINGNDGGLIPAPGLELGFHQIIYQAEDACGNIAELTVTIEVVDEVVPTTICDEITDVALTTDGTAIVFAETFDDGSYDNCCLDQFLVRRMDGLCGGGFDDFGPTVEFCCEDLTNNNIMVVFRAVDCYGNFNDCMVEVEVEDKLPPTVSCPPPVQISCDEYLEELDAAIQAEDYSLLEQFGTSTAFDNCEAIVTYNVNVNINSCAEGTISRTWSVVDPSGNGPISCTQIISVFHVSDWVVEFPADIDATCVDGDLPDFGEPEIFHDECELIGTSFEDVYFYIVPDACYKIERTWTVINWCIYEDYGYDVWEEDGFAECNIFPPFTDWDGDGDSDCRTFRDGWNESGTPGTPDGYIDYKQIIKVVDNDEPTFEIPEIDGCIVETDCDKDLVIPYPNIMDVCSPDFEVDITGDFGVFNDIQGDITIDDVVPGTYDIYYTVTDNCGNQAYDDVTVVVEDCKKPTPYCKNGLVVELMQTGMVDVWASDFDAGSFDNCPGDLLFSFSSDVNDIGTTLTCVEVGQVSVTVWVTDAAGNQDFCETVIILQDNMNACPGIAVNIAGAVETEEGDGVENVSIEVNGGLFTVLTDNFGSYSIPVEEGGDYSISSLLDSDHENGVTTYDLVLITQHILGINALSSPYKLIAADANHSETITTLDMVAIRKVILQIDNSFPNNTSWRFVTADYEFPVPGNPWSEVFPELYNYNNLAQNVLNGDFVGIKIGDVNGTAQANSLMVVDDRTFNGTFELTAQDRSLKAGETFTVNFTAKEAEVMGYQFTMNFDQSALELVEVVEGVAKDEHFGLALVENGAITTSWNTAEARTFADGENVFSLVFTAKAAVQLSEVLSLNSRYTKAEAYNAQSELINVQLQLEGAAKTAGFALYQNTPNPFRGTTQIGFNLPEASAATLTIMDVSGKVLRVIEGDFAAGYNEVRISNLNTTGVLYYQLDTDEFSATKKMIIIE